ncbi:hypothetical protein [Cognatiyoonia sp. IB215182]|uniref:hypothetical protein n=1 Tax=Cognatiyoonia sp. IB215182 TaxID=3097353 RepID=UPI002A0D2D28|nr:hypothetical protein [Cognatiyoonia sp. IB215182]MDX8355548.1 hypothetical protein [Cognatiyoonia sp. IB215182]
MRTTFYRFALAIWASTNAAMACTDDPNENYDDIYADDASIVLAFVTDVSVPPLQPNCMQVSYDVAQYLHGSVSDEFSVTICEKDTLWADAIASHSTVLELFGYVAGAEVLLAVVTEGDSDEAVRYADPNCTGFLHFNMDPLTPERRAQVLDMFQTNIEKRQ